MRCAVGIRVGVVERDPAADQILRQAALVAGQVRDTGQPQRVVGHQQIDPRFQGFGHDGLDRIDGDQHGLHVRPGIPADQTHRVPRFGKIRREPGIEHRYHVAEPHVGPAGLEPTTFPV